MKLEERTFGTPCIYKDSFSSRLFIQECINDRELRLIGTLHENRQVRQCDVRWVVGK